MNVAKTALLVLCGGYLVLYQLACAWAAITGRDIQAFDSYRASKPSAYHNLRGILRINGPLVALLSGFILSGMVVHLLSGGSVSLGAAASAPLLAVNLWLSVRWTFWAWRGSSLRADLNLDFDAGDNLAQAVAIAVSVVLGALAGLLLASGDMAGLLVGAFAGLVFGLLLSGLALMVYHLFSPRSDQ